MWYLKKGFMKTFKTFNLFEVQQRSLKIKIYLKFILVKSPGTLGITRVKFYKRKGKGNWIRESWIYELMGSHSLIIILCSLSCFCLSGVCLLFFRVLVCLFSLQLWKNVNQRNSFFKQKSKFFKGLVCSMLGVCLTFQGVASDPSAFYVPFLLLFSDLISP